MTPMAYGVMIVTTLPRNIIIPVIVPVNGGAMRGTQGEKPADTKEKNVTETVGNAIASARWRQSTNVSAKSDTAIPAHAEMASGI